MTLSPRIGNPVAVVEVAGVVAEVQQEAEVAVSGGLGVVAQGLQLVVLDEILQGEILTKGKNEINPFVNPTTVKSNQKVPKIDKDP
jgi:hypothetical protein